MFRIGSVPLSILRRPRRSERGVPRSGCPAGSGAGGPGWIQPQLPLPPATPGRRHVPALRQVRRMAPVNRSRAPQATPPGGAAGTPRCRCTPRESPLPAQGTAAGPDRPSGLAHHGTDREAPETAWMLPSAGGLRRARAESQRRHASGFHPSQRVREGVTVTCACRPVLSVAAVVDSTRPCVLVCQSINHESTDPAHHFPSALAPGLP